MKIRVELYHSSFSNFLRESKEFNYSELDKMISFIKRSFSDRKAKKVGLFLDSENLRFFLNRYDTEKLKEIIGMISLIYRERIKKGGNNEKSC